MKRYWRVVSDFRYIDTSFYIGFICVSCGKEGLETFWEDHNSGVSMKQQSTWIATLPHVISQGANI